MSLEAQKWREAREAYRTAERAYWDAENELVKQVASQEEVPAHSVSITDEWECEKSPSGYCMFVYGTCIHCKEPIERP